MVKKTKSEEIKTFGVFGKWSKETLRARRKYHNELFVDSSKYFDDNRRTLNWNYGVAEIERIMRGYEETHERTCNQLDIKIKKMTISELVQAVSFYTDEKRTHQKVIDSYVEIMEIINK